MMKKICILGLGYIGLPTAAMFANSGFEVLGVDINEKIINTLHAGGIHIYEPGLEELVRQAIESGKLTVSLEPEIADAFIIAVPTPFNQDKTADMRAVISAARMIEENLHPGNLVILESTSPPLTTVNLVMPILEESGLKAGKDFFLAYSPERVLPGKILHELVYNARVIGGVTPASAQAGQDLYISFVKGEIVITDATTAEMVKLMENTYRDVNIAIANEFSRLADRFGVNVWEAIRIANLHPRVKILNPGPGVGGHCISVDPWFLVEKAPDLTPLILASRTVNDSQPYYVMDMIKRIWPDLSGHKITLLGLAYKPDVDDLRESPAMEVGNILAEAGAEVVAFEPLKTEATFQHFRTTKTLEEALKDAEAVVLLVAHKVFRDMLPEDLAAGMPGRTIVDCVNICRESEWRMAGFSVHKLGVGKNM